MSFKDVFRASLTSDSSTALVEPGTVWQDGASGKMYRYVLVEDAALAANDVVEFSDNTGYEVTKDRSGGGSLGRIVAGVAIGVISDGQYGWIQVVGKATVKVAAGVAIAAGNILVPDATNDGCAAAGANGSTVEVTAVQKFGVALGADSATTSAAGTAVAMIQCL